MEKTETSIMTSEKRMIDPLESISLFWDIINNTELKYFNSVKQFPSIPELFSSTIRKLRLSGEEKNFKGLLQLDDKEKGQDIFNVYTKYRDYMSKNNLLDFSDVIGIFLNIELKENEHIILFPRATEGLAYANRNALRI